MAKRSTPISRRQSPGARGVRYRTSASAPWSGIRRPRRCPQQVAQLRQLAAPLLSPYSAASNSPALACAGAERTGRVSNVKAPSRTSPPIYRRGRQRRGQTGAAWNTCWTAAWPTNAGPWCTGACSIANASGAWRTPCARWAERFAVQLARSARQLDPQLLRKPAPVAQLWRELEELLLPFELAATPEPPSPRRRSARATAR